MGCEERVFLRFPPSSPPPQIHRDTRRVPLDDLRRCNDTHSIEFAPSSHQKPCLCRLRLSSLFAFLCAPPMRPACLSRSSCHYDSHPILHAPSESLLSRSRAQ